MVSHMKGDVLEEHNLGERRHFHRFHRAEPVRFQLKDPSQFGGCLSCDLSEGGIRLRLNDFIPLNTELSLQIQLADEPIVGCVCRVAWVEKSRFGDHYQAGLEFIEDGSILDAQRKIRRILSQYL